jgi:hypothetical protein
MGFLGGVLKKVVSGLSKIADIVAPICSFIPGLNPVVTLIAAGIKAVDGLTDKPPNLGKIFDGVMGLIPGGALGKVLGPFAKLGGGTAGKFVEMFTGAIAGKGPGAGGMLGDLLTNVLGNARIGGPNSPLAGLANTLLSNFADKVRSPMFNNAMTELVTMLTKSKPGDLLSADQIAAALSQPTGKMVERLIDGVATKVPEAVIHPELMKLLGGLANQTMAEVMRDSSVYNPAQQAPVNLSPATSQPVVQNVDAAAAAAAMEQIRRSQGKS